MQSFNHQANPPPHLRWLHYEAATKPLPVLTMGVAQLVISAYAVTRDTTRQFSCHRNLNYRGGGVDVEQERGRGT
jgi:hypothetical protein